MSYAHTQADVDQLLEVYLEVFFILAEYEGREHEVLRCEVPKPLFKVR